MDNKQNKGSETFQKEGTFNKSQKTKDVRLANIQAAKLIADCIRTSLGPRGMDKMIQDPKGQTIISNDGATILQKLDVVHPTAKMVSKNHKLVQISKAQDIEAGDGTTSVVVIAGALLQACQFLLTKGLHPNTISQGFQKSLIKSLQILNSISIPVSLDDKQNLIECVNTALSSKIVSNYTKQLSPMAVNAVLNIIESQNDTNVNLKNIRISKKIGGTIEDTEMIQGIIFEKNRPSHKSGGISRMENAKIALIQFQIATPKTDIQNTVIVKNYHDMDRIMREQKKIIAQMVFIINKTKKIKNSGCNVLLIQKSILKDATNDLSLHFLAKKGIMVVQDIQRQDVPFISKVQISYQTLGCVPISHISYLTPDKFGSADLCQQYRLSDDSKIFRITGLPKNNKTMSILIRGSNPMIVDEAQRSLHDALCVIRCLVKKRSMVPGGGAVEIQIAQKLDEYSQGLIGAQSIIMRAYAQALEIIPLTLAENAGMNPISVVTELRNRHSRNQIRSGISVKKCNVAKDITEQNVIQPYLVTENALTLATEVVRMILKIDDVVISAR